MNHKDFQHSADLDVGKEEGVEDQLRVTVADPDRYSLCDKSTGVPTTSLADAEIGRGGIGRVLIAFDQHLGRKIAIKELLPAKVGDSLDEVFLSPAPSDTKSPDEEEPKRSRQRAKNTVARFLREARVTGQLGHPSIVPVYELGRKSDGTLYYTMKVVHGRTLAQALDQCKDLKQRLGLLTHFIDLCQAIAYAHSRGVVHRDIKPANVMVGEFGETVVLDWGLAKVRGIKDIRSTELEKDIEMLRGCGVGQTVDGTAIGTPAYMSPEQAAGDVKAMDERSDIWSLGAVLYRILTGRPPFTGETPFEIMLEVQRKEITAVREICSDAPAELSSICAKALNRDRNKRYRGAKDLADDVNAYLTGGRVAAYEYNIGDLLTKWISKHRIPVTTALVSLLLLITIGIASYVRVVRERDIAQQLKKEADHARHQAKLRMAESFWEGARAALLKKNMLEARAKLRSSMEVTDSVASRMLWSKTEAIPLVWKRKFSSPIHSLAVSPSGDEIAVAGLDGSIYLMDRTTSQGRILRGHKSWVASLVYSHDGSHLFSAGADKVIRIWDTGTGNLISSMTGHSATIHDIAVRPKGDLLASSSQDKTIRIWDVSSGKQIRKLDSFGTIAWSIAFTPDGRRLVAGCRDGSIHVLELHHRSLSTIKVMKQPTGGVSAIAISSSGDLLASGSNDSKIYIWNLDDYSPKDTALYPLAGHTDGIAELAFSPDERWLASGSYDSTVRLWPIAPEADQQGSVLKEHKDWIAGVEFLPKGKFLATASEDNTVALWKLPLKQWPQKAESRVHNGALTTIAIDPSGSVIATGGEDRTIRLWDAATGRFIKTLRGHKNPIYGLKFSTTGILFSSDWTKEVYTWAKGDRGYEKKAKVQLPGDGDLNTNMAIDPSGRYLAAGDYDRSIRLWDLVTGKEHILKGHTDLVRSVTFSSDSKLLASASWDRTIRIWNPKTGKCIRVFTGHLSEVNDLIFSPDNKTLYSTGWDLSIRKWDIRNNKKATIGIINQRYEVMSISPDGKTIAGGMANGEIEVWDLATGHCEKFKAHDNTIYDLIFSPDGASLLSASEDGTVRAFNPKTLQPVWNAPLMLSRTDAPPLVYTHEGWLVPGFGKLRPTLPSRSWISDAQKSRNTLIFNHTACVKSDDGLAIWDTERDIKLKTLPIPNTDRVLAFDEGCAVMANGVTTLYYPTSASRKVCTDSTAMAIDKDKILVADEHYLHILETNGLERNKVQISAGTSAVARLEHKHFQWFFTGYADGTVEIHDGDGAQVKLTLQQSPSSPVTLIMQGPMETAIIGFSNGLLGLWDLDSGVRLDAARLHGRPSHLAMFGGYLYAVSDLGDNLKWDLRIFQNTYCEMLQKIWNEVPVVWEKGRPIKKAPDAHHVCSSLNIQKRQH